jgi:hypothetical protein
MVSRNASLEPVPPFDRWEVVSQDRQGTTNTLLWELWETEAVQGRHGRQTASGLVTDAIDVRAGLVWPSRQIMTPPVSSRAAKPGRDRTQQHRPGTLSKTVC